MSNAESYAGRRLEKPYPLHWTFLVRGGKVMGIQVTEHKGPHPVARPGMPLATTRTIFDTLSEMDTP